MARNNQRGRNNNPEGRNQYSSGWMDSARERPLTTAATAAAAVGAGVFLWSRRNQISDQITSLSDQIGEWTEGMRSGSQDREFEIAGGDSEFSGTTGSSTSGSGSRRSGSSKGGRSTGMRETGGGTPAGTSGPMNS